MSVQTALVSPPSIAVKVDLPQKPTVVVREVVEDEAFTKDAKTQENRYALSRNLAATFRLAGQSQLHHLRNGWLLHPTVAASLKGKDDIKIADIAAGQCYFNLALSRQMPHAKLVALDISDEQYPAPSRRPKNIEFGLWNIFSDVPEQYIGTFDVVHLRLICAATMHRDRSMIWRNLLKLLKPGGYLQYQEVMDKFWAETDANGTLLLDSHPAVEELGNIMNEAVPLWTHVKTYIHLDQELADAGFRDVQKHDIPCPVEFLDYETYNVLELVNDFELGARQRREADEGFYRRLAVAKERLVREVEGGLRLCNRWPVFVGRK